VKASLQVSSEFRLEATLPDSHMLASFVATKDVFSLSHKIQQHIPIATDTESWNIRENK
jgi:hypothetical protein